MKKINLGLQIYSVREAFIDDPVGTLKRIATMGYEGVELNFGALEEDFQVYKNALDEYNLSCFGAVVSWHYLQPDTLSDTLKGLTALGTNNFIIGSVNPSLILSEPDYPKKAVDYMNTLYESLSKEGFHIGYHNHAFDFESQYDGKSLYEYIIENTPDNFMMVLDTGNAQAGGGNPLELVRKFPNRTPIMHLKGYSSAQQLLAPVWDSDTDWETLIDEVLMVGGARILDIEFGTRGDYEPFERAEQSLNWLKNKLNNIKNS